MKTRLFLFIFILGLFSIAQKREKLDSLLKEFNRSALPDSTKIKITNALAYGYANLKPDSAIFFARKSVQLAHKVNNPSILGTAFNVAGVCYHFSHQYDSAIYYYNLAARQLEKSSNKKGLINTLNNIGLIHFNRGNYDKAIEDFNFGLKAASEIHDTASLAQVCNYLATVYYNRSSFEKALSYFMRAEKYFIQLNDIFGLSQTHNNMGNLYYSIGKPEKAKEFYLASIEDCKKVGDVNNMASALSNLGSICSDLGQHDKALNYFNQSLQLAVSAGNKYAQAVNLQTMGDLYYKTGNENKALEHWRHSLFIFTSIEEKRGMADVQVKLGNYLLKQKDTELAAFYFQKSLQLAKDLKAPDIMMEDYLGLSKIAEHKEEFKKGHDFLKLYASLKDSILTETSAKSLAEMQARYDTEKKEAEISSLKKDKKLEEITMLEQETNEKKQKVVIGISSGGIAMVLLLGFFIQKGYREKKAASLVLEARQIEILARNKLLEEKNTVVKDSIEYAREIQEIVRPTEEQIGSYFKESFILYKPKDIVAGDFYWLSANENNAGPAEVSLAVCDCTGHGVPGAFMALHGYSLLDRISRNKKYSSPSEILDKLNEEVRSTMHQENSEKSAKYGIDMGLVKVTGNNVEFAGARNPLIICADELQEIKADRIYIGGSKDNFTNHKLQVPAGAMMYMFSDGYPDQKGGSEGRKYFVTAFKELLLQVSSFPAVEQKKILEETFEKWKENYEQIDDVLVIGIRV